MTVPLASLYSSAGINKVFLVDGDKAREIQVVLGEQSKDWVEILEPAIPPTSRVITSGQRMLSDDAPIVLRQAGQTTTNEAETR